MGAGGSILQSLPEECTREHVRSVAGSLYDEGWFREHLVGADENSPDGNNDTKKKDVVLKSDLIAEADSRGILSSSQVFLYNLNRWKVIRHSLEAEWDKFETSEQVMVTDIPDIRNLCPLKQNLDTGEEEYDGRFRQRRFPSGLSDITDESDDYYGSDDDDNIDGVEEDDAPGLLVRSAKDHHKHAKQYLGQFRQTIVAVLNAANLSSSEYDKDENTGTLYFPKTVKSLQRMIAKAQSEYNRRKPGPAASWILDAVRCSIILDTPQEIFQFLECLKSRDDLELLRLKNRFYKPLFQGYRDMLINVVMKVGNFSDDSKIDHTKASKYTCEVQVHLRSLFVLGKELRSHDPFEFFRHIYNGNMTAVSERVSCLVDAQGEEKLDGSESQQEENSYLNCDDLINPILKLLSKAKTNEESENAINRAKKLSLLLHDIGEFSSSAHVLESVANHLRQNDSSGIAATEESIGLSSLLNDLAWEFIRTHDYPKAIAAFEEAASISKELDVPEVMEIHARALEGKGLALDQSNQDAETRQEAGRCIDEAIELFRKASSDGQENLQIALALANKAIILIKLKQIEEADAMFTEALQLQRSLGASKRDIARTLNNFGICCFLTGLIDKSRDLLRQALDIRIQWYGRDHFHVAMTYDSLAKIDLKSGNLTAAAAKLRKVVAIHKSVYGTKHVKVARAMEDCAEILRRIVIGSIATTPEDEAKGVISSAALTERTNNDIMSRSGQGLEMAISETVPLKDASSKTMSRRAQFGVRLTAPQKRAFGEALELFEKALEIKKAVLLDPKDPGIVFLEKRIAKLSFRIGGVPRQQESHRRLLKMTRNRPSMRVLKNGTMEFQDSSILFGDIVDFSGWTTKLEGQEEDHNIGSFLSMWFSLVEKVLPKCPRVHQVKTSGDAIMAWSGFEKTLNPSHADDILRFAVTILEGPVISMREKWGENFNVRIGIHSGLVSLGQLRGKNSNYEVYGETVNTAWRMQELSPVGSIMLSEDTAFKLGDGSKILERASSSRSVDVKGKGPLDVHVVMVAAGESLVKYMAEENNNNNVGTLSTVDEQSSSDGSDSDSDNVEKEEKSGGGGSDEAAAAAFKKEREDFTDSAAAFFGDTIRETFDVLSDKEMAEIMKNGLGGCFHGDAQILMADGTFQTANSIVVGDKVATSTTPLQTNDDDYGSSLYMYPFAIVEACAIQHAAPRILVQIPTRQFGNLFISRPHRIQSPQGLWIKPEQYPNAKLVETNIELYNFVTKDTSESMVVNGIIASTYGQLCLPSHNIDCLRHQLWGSRRIVRLMRLYCPDWPNIEFQSTNDPFLWLFKQDSVAEYLVDHINDDNDDENCKEDFLVQAVISCVKPSTVVEKLSSSLVKSESLFHCLEQV